MLNMIKKYKWSLLFGSLLSLSPILIGLLLWNKLPAIAENAVGDACTGSNPRPIDSEKMAELFKCCYYGTPVNL